MKRGKHNNRQAMTLALGLVALLAVYLVAVIMACTNRSNVYVNLINGHDWANLSGAEVKSNGVHITPLNQSIIHQDGSKAQLNPPVNVRGPHLAVDGSFEVAADMQGAEDGASLQLYGAVPIVYDEWRQERPSVRIDVSNGRVEAYIWDGNSSTPMDMRSYNVTVKNKVQLNVTHINGNIIVAINGKNLGTMPDHNIFSSGTVWFGADGNDKGNGWLLSSLRARPLANGKLSVVDPQELRVDISNPMSLRNLANGLTKKLAIGAAVSVNPLFTDSAYKYIAASEFNTVTLESSLKPQFLHPAKNKYD